MSYLEGNVFRPVWSVSGRSGAPGKVTMPLTETIRLHHRAQSDICDKLEALADCLPDCADKQTCLHLSREIRSVVKLAHHFEESELFPILAKAYPDDKNLPQTLERLRYEHWEDESFADEVADALSDFVSHPERANIQSIGYMLRGFFEGMRRHIAFEREHILPMVQQAMAV